MLYYKDKSGKFIPVDVNYFDFESLKNTLVVAKIGDKDSFQPKDEDIENITKWFSDILGKHNIDGIVTHDQFSLEIIDKDSFKDKLLVIRIGDKDGWKPSEKYLTEVRRDFKEALESAGIRDVVVLDVLADIDAQ